MTETPRRPIAPARSYKVGTRKIDQPSDVSTGTAPWWASTDPDVFAEGQKAAIERGRRVKAPGEDCIVGMGGAR